MSLKEIILLHVVNQPSFNKIFLLFYFAALETLFPPLLIMDSLQRLSFWQTNVRKKTTAGKEETIIEINQENGENKKETNNGIGQLWSPELQMIPKRKSSSVKKRTPLVFHTN